MQDSSALLNNAIVTYVNIFLPSKNQCHSLKSLCDGIFLSTLLKSADGFRFNFGQINDKTQNWFEKIHNIRIIISKVQQYFNNRIGKGIRTKDINVIEIVRHSKEEEIIKLFEIVLAVLTEATNKEEHIEKILSLTQEKQKVFIEIIQNITEKRYIGANEGHEDKVSFVIEQIETQNNLLREEVIRLQNQRQMNLKELQDLRKRISKSEDEFQKNMKLFQHDPQEMSLNTMVHNEQLKGLVQNLKKKVIKMTRDHEIQVFYFKDQICQQERKIEKLEKYSEICQLYQQKYNETEDLIVEARSWERQKSKLMRIVQERESMIKKIQQKMDQLMEENCAVQQRQIYLQMQLQKRQIRFKQLQKQVKKRMNFDESTFWLSEKSMTSNSLELNQEEKEEMEEIREELQQIKTKERQSFKEAYRLKREVQRSKNYEKEKKKLEGIILELSREKKDELEILLGVVGQLGIENRKYLKMLEQNKIQMG